MIPKSVFDDAVFERMETNDHRATAGLNPVGQSACQELLEVFEFVIDGNPQSLKNPCGGMNFLTPLRPARQRLSDGCHEIGRRPLAEIGTTGDDGTRDRPAGAVFSKLLKEFGQVRFAEC